MTDDDLKQIHSRLSGRFRSLVRAIEADQWHLPTPCSEWDVRRLVEHLTAEARWVPHLMDGAKIEEVGDRFEGDLLGEDPVSAWEEAAAEAVVAVQAVDPGRTVHLSFGDVPAEEYIFQLTTDLLIHGWDLARAIGADETLDPAAVELCYRRIAPLEDTLKQTGLYGQKVEPPPAADLQTKLLAVLGRVA